MGMGMSMVENTHRLPMQNTSNSQLASSISEWQQCPEAMAIKETLITQMADLSNGITTYFLHLRIQSPVCYLLCLVVH